MKNKKAFDFFKKMSQQKESGPYSVKLVNNIDCTDIDANFILKNSNKNSNILDLGSGTGIIVNKIYDKIGFITCVEPFDDFTKYIDKSDNIIIVNSTLKEFETEKKFDLITAFGIMQYFSEQEAIDLYTKYYSYLKIGGKFIIKNQFGVNEDVIVDGFSEEQKTNYFSSYRYINKELKILEKIGLTNIKIEDIYPPESNRWENTHYYAIVADK